MLLLSLVLLLISFTYATEVIPPATYSKERMYALALSVVLPFRCSCADITDDRGDSFNQVFVSCLFSFCDSWYTVSVVYVYCVYIELTHIAEIMRGSWINP